MCFIIHKDHSEVKKVEEDITCYKVLGSTDEEEVFEAPLYYFNYTIGEKYNCFDSSKEKTFNLISSGDNTLIEEGFHSWSTIHSAKEFVAGNQIIFKAIIPKGSLYYYNPRSKDYVSNQIIIKSKIKE